VTAILSCLKIATFNKCHASKVRQGENMLFCQKKFKLCYSAKIY
jgi:hypothetical protein